MHLHDATIPVRGDFEKEFGVFSKKKSSLALEIMTNSGINYTGKWQNNHFLHIRKISKNVDICH